MEEMIQIWCSTALSIWQIDGRTLLSFRQDTTRRSHWLSDCSNNNIMSRITVAVFWLKIFEIKHLRGHNRLGNQSFLVFLVKFWSRTSFCLRGKSLKTTTKTERDGTGIEQLFNTCYFYSMQNPCLYNTNLTNRLD